MFSRRLPSTGPQRQGEPCRACNRAGIRTGAGRNSPCSSAVYLAPEAYSAPLQGLQFCKAFGELVLQFASR